MGIRSLAGARDVPRGLGALASAQLRCQVRNLTGYSKHVVNSTEPFGKALRALMEARGLSYRGLADAISRLDDRGMTHAHLNMLANGHDKPSIRAIELISRACKVSPEYFAEYRLTMAMRELDPAVVGLDQALANLNARLGARRKVGAKGNPAPRRPARPRPTG
jgi:transcriptional regulator with XRE-family HTH domain